MAATTLKQRRSPPQPQPQPSHQPYQQQHEPLPPSSSPSSTKVAASCSRIAIVLCAVIILVITTVPLSSLLLSSLSSSSSSTPLSSDVTAITRTLLLSVPETDIVPPSTSTTSTASSLPPSASIDDRYIVSFHDYRARDDHQRTLSSIFSSPSASTSDNSKNTDEWHVVDRHNAATAFPTDFLLLSFTQPASPSVVDLLSTLRASPLVRYVVPDRPVSLAPLLASNLENDPTDTHGRFTMPRGGTSSTSSDDAIDEPETTTNRSDAHNRKLHGFFGDDSVTGVQDADWVWKQGFTGSGIRVAIFDTGLAATHPHFRHIRERTNWTGDKTLDDTQGHGTSVAGIIASHTECHGFAPDADLHIFRVFDSKVTSYTAWFLDAFNYAIHTRVNILNLSIGGPDWADRPFVDKVHELAANGVIVVSAIGNVETGKPPLWGSLNNPADQLDVLGVGGIDFNNQLARFSARGMTTWELPTGYGRIKPDVVAQGANVRASGRSGGCKAQSGTSFASPVAAGVATLLSSIITDETERKRLVNPASMKQVITESAIRVTHGGSGIYEQGMGRLNLRGAYDLLSRYQPRASVLPPSLDLTDCPYMWPFCTQPLYHTGQPAVMNMTILNGMSVSGYLAGSPVWYPDNKASEDALAFEFTYPRALWPWSGYLGVFISVATPLQSSFIASGFVSFTVISDDDAETQSTVNFTVRVACVATPPRHKRLLWDQFHNLNYPSGYFPRDDIHVLTDVLDWNGDHPHTNFRDLYIWLREQGYFLEVLRHDYTCFDASLYGALLIVDPEEEYFAEEVAKLTEDVAAHGLSLIILADWYNLATFPELKFHDQNTKRWWLPITGGANIPALNDLLHPYGAAFGDRAWYGSVEVGGQSTHFASGTSIARWPRGGYLLQAQLTEPHPDQGRQGHQKHLVPFMGAIPGANVLDALRLNGGAANYSWLTDDLNEAGRIVVYGDSNCWDMKDRAGQPCYRVMEKMLEFALGGDKGLGHIDDHSWPSDTRVVSSYISDMMQPPLRPDPNHEFKKHSHVLAAGARPQCLDGRPPVNGHSYYDASSPSSLTDSDNNTVRRLPGRETSSVTNQQPIDDDNVDTTSDTTPTPATTTKPRGPPLAPPRVRPRPITTTFTPPRGAPSYYAVNEPPRTLWWIVVACCLFLFGVVWKRRSGIGTIIGSHGTSIGSGRMPRRTILPLHTNHNNNTSRNNNSRAIAL